MPAARILIADLNNFARYPTVAVGYLVSILRRAGFEVSVFSPLSTGVTGVARETPVRPWGLVEQSVRYGTAISGNSFVRRARARAAEAKAPALLRSQEAVEAQFRQALNERYDAVLISTYLMYFDLTRSLAETCRIEGIPVLLGGPYFAVPEVVREWADLPGVAGIASGEIEPHLPEVVTALCEKRDLSGFPGIVVSSQNIPRPPPPLKELDAVPFPDYSDFPWTKYPNRIVPLVTGRGCGWGVCRFCSDITSTAGRSYRSRSPENVLEELAYQSRANDSRLFVFADLKLNSNPAVWRALGNRMQEVVPGAQFVGSIHAGPEDAPLLSRPELRKMRDAGLVRMTTGLESGSQATVDRMHKGIKLPELARVFGDANDVGISVRCTMIVGYPGEDASAVEDSARFLEQNSSSLERVMLNRFQMMSGTGFHRSYEKRPSEYRQVQNVRPRHRLAQLDHDYVPTGGLRYRKAVFRLLRAVHHINRKPLSPAAREFEGVM